MAWPFPEHLRPLIRSIDFYGPKLDWSEEAICTVLTSPPHSHRGGDFKLAWPEALRARYFGEALAEAGLEKTFGEVWAECAGSCFERAYGRAPTTLERAWAYSRPQQRLGLKFQVAVGGIENWVSTPTANLDWSIKIGAALEGVRSWFLAGLRSPPPPLRVEEAIANSAAIQVSIVPLALLARIEPTLEIRPN